MIFFSGLSPSQSTPKVHPDTATAEHSSVMNLCTRSLEFGSRLEKF